MRKLIMILALCASAVSVAPTLAEGLSTRPGLELGVQVSQYSYKEPIFDLELGGNKIGGSVAYTFVRNAWFLKAGAEVDYGVLRYSSAWSGIMTGVPDTRIEGRLVGGRDFCLNDEVYFSPYVGFGVRIVSNDTRGLSSFGASGYRRENRGLYIPIGLTARIRATGGWTVVPNLEFDHLIKGTQTSKLTDAGFPGITDAKNTQNEGYGVRASLMFEKGGWFVGPTLQFWNIGNSDVVHAGRRISAQEPANTTMQVGLELKKHF